MMDHGTVIRAVDALLQEEITGVRSVRRAARHRTPAVTALLDERTDGAPQCPMCFAHFMEPAGGSYRCPSGCAGHVVERSAASRRSVPNTFTTTRGALFVLCGV